MESNPGSSAANTLGGVAKHHIYLQKANSNERLH